MKTTTSLSLLAIALASCTSTTGPDSEAYRAAKELAAADSILALAGRESPQQAPSIDSALIEQQSIVIGTIRFGDDAKTVKAKMRELDPKYAKYLRIGKHQYTVDPIYNSKGELYRIDLDGARVWANVIETEAMRSMDAIAGSIEAKYGPPNVNTYRFFDFKPGSMQILREWRVGTKVIYAGIVETHSGSEYYPAAWIFDQPMHNAVHEEKVNADKNAKQQGASNF